MWLGRYVLPLWRRRLTLDIVWLGVCLMRISGGEEDESAPLCTLDFTTGYLSYKSYLLQKKREKELSVISLGTYLKVGPSHPGRRCLFCAKCDAGQGSQHRSAGLILLRSPASSNLRHQTRLSRPRWNHGPKHHPSSYYIRASSFIFGQTS